MDATLATELRGTSGFGYDPVFIPDGDTGYRTWAKITGEEKNKVSHRRRAVEAMRNDLWTQDRLLLECRRGVLPELSAAVPVLIPCDPFPPERRPSRAHVAPVRARPFPAPESRRPRASGPAVADPAPACRAWAISAACSRPLPRSPVALLA